MTDQHDAREALEPCPFCGGSAIYVEPDEIGSGGQWIGPLHVGCSSATGCGSELVVDGTEAEVAAAWNRRATPPAAPAPEARAAGVKESLTAQLAGFVALDLNVFAEVCHEAHIAFALDKFPSYERAIEHYYLAQLNALSASPTAQPVALTDEHIVELGHRKAWRYVYSSDPDQCTYAFNRHTLIEFVRGITQQKGSE